MSTLLAVDPSIRSTGVALFVGRELVSCARIQVPAEGSIGERVLRMAMKVSDWYGDWAPRTPLQCMIFEWPQIYAAAKSKGDPNDLPGLAAVGGAIAGIVKPITILTPTPREWTGGVPKSTKGDPWLSARGIRVASRLSPAELALVPKSHDAIDGVGLGLFALGRFQRRRVIARG